MSVRKKRCADCTATVDVRIRKGHGLAMVRAVLDALERSVTERQ